MKKKGQSTPQILDRYLKSKIENNKQTLNLNGSKYWHLIGPLPNNAYSFDLKKKGFKNLFNLIPMRLSQYLLS